MRGDSTFQFHQRDWLNRINPLLEGFDPSRPITPLEKIKAAISLMTPEEEAELAEKAYQIVQRADREFLRQKES